MNNTIIKLITVVSLLCIPLSAFSEEPENHLGWTFSELKGKFPNLLEIRKQGDLVAYAIGSADEGFASYYVVKGNVVISEMNLLKSRDDLAKKTFDTMIDLYIGSYPSFLESKDKKGAYFKFPSFKMEVTYLEDEMNIMTTKFDMTNTSISDKHSNSSGTIYRNPTVNKSYAYGLKVISVSILEDQTMITFSDNNKSSDGDYYEWISLDKNAYIVANGQKYKLRDTKGIAISPNKTYFSYAGETKTFSLYFPAIPKNTASIDFIESEDSSWRLYGILLK